MRFHPIHLASGVRAFCISPRDFFWRHIFAKWFCRWHAEQVFPYAGHWLFSLACSSPHQMHCLVLLSFFCRWRQCGWPFSLLTLPGVGCRACRCAVAFSAARQMSIACSRVRLRSLSRADWVFVSQIPNTMQSRMRILRAVLVWICKDQRFLLLVGVFGWKCIAHMFRCIPPLQICQRHLLFQQLFGRSLVCRIAGHCISWALHHQVCVRGGPPGIREAECWPLSVLRNWSIFAYSFAYSFQLSIKVLGSQSRGGGGLMPDSGFARGACAGGAWAGVSSVSDMIFRGGC